MAGCCGGGSSGTVIIGGDNITVTGSGSVTDPYVIVGDLDVILQAKDTSTIVLDLTGTGNTNDPFVLSGIATVSVNDLTDVNDPTPPVSGDTLLYDGSTWVYGPPPTQPPGLVNATGGIEGDGTVLTPLRIRVSETVDTSIDGLYTYIDANGELRAQKTGTSSVAWADITGKPTTFPPTRPLRADTVGNSDPGAHIFVQSGTPSGAVNGDIWFQT